MCAKINSILSYRSKYKFLNFWYQKWIQQPQKPIFLVLTCIVVLKNVKGTLI